MPATTSEVTPAQQALLAAAYDGALAYLDAQLARLFEELEKRNQLANTLVVSVVLVVTFVANDAIEAAGSAARLRGEGGGMVPVSQALLDRTRHIVRRSMVLQMVNQRISQLRERFRFGRRAQPDPRLLTYATPVSLELARGLQVSREAIGRIAKGASAKGVPTAIVLMPARLQLDDDEFARMRALVEPAGYHMTVDGATILFEDALRPLGLPMLDLLPAFRGAADPRAVFFGSTVHLTPAGHQLAADALTTFLDAHHLVP